VIEHPLLSALMAVLEYDLLREAFND